MFTKRAQRLSPIFNNNEVLAAAGLAAASRVGDSAIFFHQNDLIWISHETEAWVPGKVLSVVSNSKIIVQGDGGSYYKNENITIDLENSENNEKKTSPSKKKLRRFNSSSREVFGMQNLKVLPRYKANNNTVDSGKTADAMGTLVHLHEASILNNIRKRFEKNFIYTSTGIMIVAMNPYKNLDIYGTKVINKYRGENLSSGSKLQPHLYLVAGQAYQNIRTNMKNQSIIICGESGAGKTVSTKLILQYISIVGGKAGVGDMEKQILSTNPLMEAFGNAKTIRNENSSRFGKYVQILFSAQAWILGARVNNYLLEKSRVVFQPANERNYHLFYQLIAGMSNEELKDFNLQRDPFHYRYLNQGNCVEVDGVDDRLEFKKTITAMISLNMSSQTRKEIFGIIASILHLGNINFVASLSNGKVMIENPELLQSAATLLGMDINIMENCFRYKTRIVAGQTIKSPLEMEDSKQVRDAFAKDLYNKMFTWLVSRINTTLGTSQSVKSILGILDIYGFENLNTNGFEQLLINYANEKMQHLFNEEVFRSEQEEYITEGIPYSNIQDNLTKNNYDSLKIIESVPYGILSLIDEQGLLGIAGSDQALVAKMRQNFGPNGKYTSSYFENAGISSGWRGKSENFVIKHYASDIFYSGTNFVTKNNDTLPSSVEELYSSSIVNVVKEMKEIADIGVQNYNDNNKNSKSGPKRDRRKTFQRGNSFQTTLGSRFRRDLNVLVKNLKTTTSHFVRCIRPNDDSVPETFDASNVVRQLRYSGVIEALRIQRSGFPTKMDYHSFIYRYDILFADELRWNIHRSPELLDIKSLQNGILELFENDLCKKAELGRHSYKFGKTKLFLRSYVTNTLENIKKIILTSHVQLLQDMFRRRLASQRFSRVQTAANLLQKHVRGVLARRQHKAMVAQMQRKAEDMKRAMQARKEKEEEDLRMERATDIIKAAQTKLDKLQSVSNIEGNKLIVVDDGVRIGYEKCVSILQEAIESHTNGAKTFLNSANRALNAVNRCADNFRSVQVRMEEEYHRQIELREKRNADKKRREQMREAMERTRMMQEEEYLRNYIMRMKKIEMVKESSARFAMKREEDYTRWVLSERHRQQVLLESTELKRMRKEEEVQRKAMIAILQQQLEAEERLKRKELQREVAERQMMESEENYQLWLVQERARLLEVAEKKQYDHDLAIAKMERYAMRIEEEKQKTFELNVWKKFQKSLMLWQRIEEERCLNELTAMQKEEENQKRVELELQILQIEKRNSDRERVLMQAEDMQSKMYSLNQSIGSHMLNIRKYERTMERTPFVPPEVNDPFSIVRSMTDDLNRHTSQIKDSYHLRHSAKKRLLAENTPPRYSNITTNNGNESSSQTAMDEKRKMEVEDERSTEVSHQLEFQVMATSSIASSSSKEGTPTRGRESFVSTKINSSTGSNANNNASYEHGNSSGMKNADEFTDANEFEEDVDGENYIPKTPKLPRDYERMELNDLDEMIAMSGNISEKRKRYEKVRNEAKKYIHALNYGDNFINDKTSIDDDIIVPRKSANDSGVLNAAVSLMKSRRRGMSMFIGGNLLPPKMGFEGGDSADLKETSTNFTRLDDVNIYDIKKNNESKSELANIDSWISQNIPEHVRTPDNKSRSTEKMDDLMHSSSSRFLNTSNTSNRGIKSYNTAKTRSPRRGSFWTNDDNVVNTSTAEFELLRIRRNVSHLKLHGNYPTSFDEEHSSRTIPEFLLERDLKEEQEIKDLEREIARTFGMEDASLDFKISKFQKRMRRKRDELKYLESIGSSGGD